MGRDPSTQRRNFEILQRPGGGVGEPGPPGSPASNARVRLDAVATLHQLIDTLTDLSGGTAMVPSSAPRDLPLLLSPPEAAKLLSLSRAKVLDLASHGEIPSVRVGRSVRIPREPLIVWVNERTNEPGWLRARRLPPWTRGDRSLER